MDTNPVVRARRQAAVVVLSQLLVTLIMALLGGAALGEGVALSALLGGGTGAIGTAYMAYAILRHNLGSPTARVLWGFVFGWVIKVALTLALLLVAFRSPGLKPIVVFSAFVASYVVYWYVAYRGSR